MPARRRRRSSTRPRRASAAAGTAARRGVSGRGAGESSGEEGPFASFRKWFDGLSTAIQWLVRAVVAAGAVAGAIGAIVGLWYLIWPPPPPEQRASISNLGFDPNVTLAEYRVRSEAASALAPAPRREELAAEFSSTTPRKNSADPTTTGATTTGATATGATTTGPTTTTPTTPGTTTGTTTGTTGEHGLVVPLNPAARAHLDAGVHEALNGTEPVPGGTLEMGKVDLGDECLRNLESPNCGLGSSSLEGLGVRNPDGSPADLDPAEFARRLRRLLATSRIQAAPGGKLVPVGVTVNYDVSLTGFRGRTVTVRWSLHRPNGATLPYDWLRSEAARRLIGEADKDTASDSFWVPIPRTGAPFFIRLELYDEDGVRLTYGDTRPIR